MNIAEQELKYKLLSKEIKRREKLLKEEFNSLQNDCDDNPDARLLFDKYKEYYNAIIDEKIQQQNALERIIDSFDELSGDTSLTRDKLNELKDDQKSIFKIMNCITKELENYT